MSLLKKMPRWLTLFPRFVMVCALLFSAGVVVFGLHNVKRESDSTSRLTLEKGAALISALEGVLWTGMGHHWPDEVSSDLLNKAGEQPDIVSLVITNRNGTVLMAADTKSIGTGFSSPEVLVELDPTRQVKWNATELPDGMPILQMYKQFSVSQGEHRRHGGGHRMMRCGSDGDLCGILEMSIAEGTSLVIFAECDLAPLEEAQATDKKHMAVMLDILVFVGLVGCITLFLIQSHRRSRKLVQEITAFSSEILRTLPVGTISTDMDDRITSINPATQDITELTRTATTGRGLHDLLPGVWTVLEGRTAQGAAREQEVQCTVGERRILLTISASYIVTEEGEAIDMTLVMCGLEEIRRLQSELRRRGRLVAFGNMVASIAHEVRNPLSVIKGLVRSFMEASLEGSDESRMADIMTREVFRLDKVVGDLLDFARPDVLNLTDVGLNELVERAHGMMRSDMDTHKIRLEAELPEPPLSVRPDWDHMMQVLLNLFLNAVQAMPDGGRLMVRARMEGTELALGVTDTGHDIAPERLADIFSPYFITKANGMGLGLSIVYKIVETHNGTVEVASTPGEDMVFRLCFPSMA